MKTAPAELHEPIRLELTEEQQKVRNWRIAEALDAGLNWLEAEQYADSDVDCSQLRRLVKGGATPAQIASALL